MLAFVDDYGSLRPHEQAAMYMRFLSFFNSAVAFYLNLIYLIGVSFVKLTIATISFTITNAFPSASISLLLLLYIYIFVFSHYILALGTTTGQRFIQNLFIFLGALFQCSYRLRGKTRGNEKPERTLHAEGDFLFKYSRGGLAGHPLDDGFTVPPRDRTGNQKVLASVRTKIHIRTILPFPLVGMLI